MVARLYLRTTKKPGLIIWPSSAQLCAWTGFCLICDWKIFFKLLAKYKYILSIHIDIVRTWLIVSGSIDQTFQCGIDVSIDGVKLLVTVWFSWFAHICSSHVSIPTLTFIKYSKQQHELRHLPLTVVRQCTWTWIKGHRSYNYVDEIFWPSLTWIKHTLHMSQSIENGWIGPFALQAYENHIDFI